MPDSVETPERLIASITGKMFLAKRFAFLVGLRLATKRRGVSSIAGIAQASTLSLSLGKGSACAFGYEPTLLLRESSVKMQHERIGIGSQLSNNERHPLRHQPEMKATSRDSRSSFATTTGHLALRAASRGRREVRAPVERVHTLARFHLNELTDDRHAFRFGETSDSGALGFDAVA